MDSGCARSSGVPGVCAQVDPETQDPFAPDGGLLGAVPLSKDGTFMRTIPEFKYWYRLTKAFAVAFLLTFFEIFNVPVSRPILVMYFVLLFFQARLPPAAPRRPRAAAPTLPTSHTPGLLVAGGQAAGGAHDPVRPPARRPAQQKRTRSTPEAHQRRTRGAIDAVGSC